MAGAPVNSTHCLLQYMLSHQNAIGAWQWAVSGTGMRWRLEIGGSGVKVSGRGGQRTQV